MRNGLVYRKSCKDLLFYVPEKMEKNVIFKYHGELVHLGTDKTREGITRLYWFPNLRDQGNEHIKNCLKCISFSLSSGRVEGCLHTIPKGNLSFSTLHIDHFRPIDKKRVTKRHVFLVVNGFTKFVKLYATKTTSFHEAIECLTQYFKSYSQPNTIISDRGSVFTSKEF